MQIQNFVAETASPKLPIAETAIAETSRRRNVPSLNWRSPNRRRRKSVAETSHSDMTLFEEIFENSIFW
jgi:hypothetical protein